MPRRDAHKSAESKRGSKLEPRFLIIGRIRKPHGVRGELKVAVQTDDPDRFRILDRVFISRDSLDPAPRKMQVTGIRFQQHDALLKFAGIDDRDEAKLLNSQWVFVAIEDAVPLAEGEMYTYQLQGLQVVTTAGESIGVVSSILETGANDVLIVNGDKGEILIPDIPDVVKTVDLAAEVITIEPMDRLLAG